MHRVFATLGPALGILVWVFAALALLSGFGDVFAHSDAERERIVATITFRIRAFQCLAVASWIGALIVAFRTWRSSPVGSRITLCLAALFTLSVVVLAINAG
jgi:hypothetical protein